MRFTGSLSYEHSAKKRRYGEKDLAEKFKIIDFIYERFNLFGLTGEKIAIPNGRLRLPDICIPQRNIVIELDGPIHGEPLMPTDKTEIRNQDYKEAGWHLIVLNKEETKGYKLDKVEQILQKELK